MSTPQNATPPASGDGHLGALAVAAALLLVGLHDRQAHRVEVRVARMASAPVRAVAVEISRAAATAWTVRAGALAAPLPAQDWAELTGPLLARLDAARPDPPGPTVDAGMRAAYQLGATQSHRTLDLPGPAPELSYPDSPTLDVMASRPGSAIERRWSSSRQMLGAPPPGDEVTHADLSSALAPLHAAASDVDRDVRTAVNSALNLAMHDAAVREGVDLLWLAEKDACVVCLALSGSVVGSDEDFPADATFGAHPSPWWSVPGEPLRPPRHMRCRCRVEPWKGHVGPPGVPSLPEVLKREAQRSILRGFRRPSESEQVRIRAADRLLKRGTALPKTVRAYARDAVAAGHFPTSGAVPGGG